MALPQLNETPTYLVPCPEEEYDTMDVCKGKREIKTRNKNPLNDYFSVYVPTPVKDRETLQYPLNLMRATAVWTRIHTVLPVTWPTTESRTQSNATQHTVCLADALNSNRRAFYQSGKDEVLLEAMVYEPSYRAQVAYTVGGGVGL
jgi:hypothetical protein